MSFLYIKQRNATIKETEIKKAVSPALTERIKDLLYLAGIQETGKRKTGEGDRRQENGSQAKKTGDRKMELRETILEGTLEVFNRKGIKFTMDDIARTLNISKKTIYTVFEDKNALFMDMVDYLFDSIKESEQQVLTDESLGTLEKIKKILGVMPEGYKNVDFRQLYMLKDKYPAIYQRVEERLETGWESTISLLEQGMEGGVIRKVSIPLVKMMLEASLEQFFRRDILIRNNLGYTEALEKVVDILVDGIAVHSDK